MMKCLKTLMTVLSIFFIVGCVVRFETPKSPPSLIIDNKDNILSQQDILNYQEAILNYITYLEQYYITIGVYYGGKVNLPQDKYKSQCKILLHLFEDIDLPPPPVIKNNSINDTIHELIDHITDLRKLIRSNNLHMEKLRQQYKNCQ